MFSLRPLEKGDVKAAIVIDAIDRVPVFNYTKTIQTRSRTVKTSIRSQAPEEHHARHIYPVAPQVLGEKYIYELSPLGLACSSLQT